MYPYPKVFDGVVPEVRRLEVAQFLSQVGWRAGWMSNSKTDKFTFFHAHFGGSLLPDHDGAPQVDCLAQLPTPLRPLWEIINNLVPEQTLLRCYANAYPYGSEGTVHTDSVDPLSRTWIYYPHAEWHANWAGETMFYSVDSKYLMAAVEPKPGRLICFEGRIPHVGRGVTRSCPAMRVTLMFKTSVKSS